MLKKIELNEQQIEFIQTSLMEKLDVDMELSETSKMIIGQILNKLEEENG